VGEAPAVEQVALVALIPLVDYLRSGVVTDATLHAVFDALWEHRVTLEGLLLKPNMVLPGTSSPRQASVQGVAEATVRCLRRTVPLRTWGGDPARVADAQRAFHHRARCNSAARSGAYTPELERSAA
jgi:fructose-bisphosphate aldolase class I